MKTAISRPAAKPLLAPPRRCRAWALAGLLALLGRPAAAALPGDVQRVLESAGIPDTAVSVVVQRVDRDAVPALTHNPRQAMNPASVMKLVTTYAALDLLGPAWTWQTLALADRPPRDGRLDGPLYLRGGGDPRFAIEHLTALLRQLRTRGIEELRGDIVLDDSLFELPPSDPAAFDDKPMRPYNVAPGALLINFGALAFTLLPGESAPQLLLETPSDGLRVDNRIVTGNGPCGDWKEALRFRLLPEGDGQRLEASGSFSAQCGERSLNLAPLTGTAHAAGMIRAIWRELGGRFAGEVRSGTTPPGALPLARHTSAPLTEAVRDINKFSNNVMARQVLLALAGDPPPATTARAVQRLRGWLAARRLDFPELVVENGAGLSRSERLSAESLTRLLRDAWQSPVMPEFIASLPIVGIDGTMQKRLTGSAATGRAHIKTGTLDGVRAAAGYAMDGNGERYSIVFLINHPRAQAGRPAIDALLLWLARQMPDNRRHGR